MGLLDHFPKITNQNAAYFLVLVINDFKHKI